MDLGIKILLTNSRNEIFRRQTKTGETSIAIFTRNLGQQRETGGLHGALLWLSRGVEKHDRYRDEKDCSERLPRGLDRDVERGQRRNL